MIIVEFANEQSRLPIDQQRLRSSVQMICADALVQNAKISLAVVDDPTIRELNRRWLGHDEPTDVLSFGLNAEGSHLEGEIIVSSDMASASASRYGWTPHDELLLYVIHGALHLVGYDDQSPERQTQMREREAHYLVRFDLHPKYDDDQVGCDDSFTKQEER